MMTADDVLLICRTLMDNDIWFSLNGGWGIDALLGKQTRAHKDLDLFCLAKEANDLRRLLADEGYTVAVTWEENATMLDEDGIDVLTAFVLQDAQGRQVDVHALDINEDGDGVPAWTAPEGFYFAGDDLNHPGSVAGEAVLCLAPAAQLACHQGYLLPSEQQCDLVRLRERFGLA